MAGVDLKQLIKNNYQSKEELQQEILEQAKAVNEKAIKQVSPLSARLGEVTSQNLTAGMNQTEISKVYGVNKSTVKRWADKAGLPADKKNPYTLEQIKQITAGKEPTDRAETIYKGAKASDIKQSYGMNARQFNNALTDLGIPKKKEYSQEEVNLITGNTYDRISYNDLAKMFGYNSLKEMLDDLSDGTLGALGYMIIDSYNASHGKDIALGVILEDIKEVDKEAYHQLINAYISGGI